jgi:hypothetical protein
MAGVSPAEQTMQASQAIDFAAVVEALQANHGSLAGLAARLGISRGALRGYLDGSQPPHSKGCRLIDAWCSVTRRNADEAPRAAPSLTARTAGRLHAHRGRP